MRGEMHMMSWITVLGVFGVLVTGAARAPSQDSPGPSNYTLSSCKETNAEVDMPEQIARTLVPAEFALVGQGTGTAKASFSLIACSSASMSDQPVTLNSAGIVVVPPTAAEFYAKYEVVPVSTTNAAFVHFLNDLGFSMLRDPTVSIAYEQDAAGNTKTEANLGKGLYGSGHISTRGAPPSPVGNVAVGIYGRRSGKKLARHIVLTNATLSNCTGSLTGTPGSSAAKAFAAQTLESASVPLSGCLNIAYDNMVVSTSVE